MTEPGTGDGGEAPRRQTRLGRGPEFDRIRAMLALEDGVALDGAVRVGPGDDAAVLEPIEGPIVVSCDASIEGVHFRLDWMTAADAGYRAAAVAVSDLAAMAARAVALLVSYAAPPEAGADLVVELQRGVVDLARDAEMSVAGGDLTRSSGPLMIDVVAIGRAGSPVLRSGARPGDELWVTGRLGGSAEVVARLSSGRPVPDDAVARYRRPAPRLKEGSWLSEAWRPTAMIDLSDGLAGDAGHLAAASGTSVVLDGERIPVAPWIRDAASEQPSGSDDALQRALHGGDDYELCFTVPPDPGRATRGLEAPSGLPLTRVGTIVEAREEPVWLRWGGEEVPLARGGFDHFTASSDGATAR